MEFKTFAMHGQTARRRVLHYGLNYGYENWKLTQGEPVPDFLRPLQERVAEFMDVAPDDLQEVLITEYAPGAGIGWHRDAPPFGKVAGVSLAAACVFKLRESANRGSSRVDLTLPPRSAYIIDGPARSRWQHSIPGVKTLRYSVTFRTLKKPRART